ncbi:hypothetical protein ABZ208_26460 [Streptomyces sp. NPDC006208]|uniref:hypothetical protein n=1 Tax=Streptomyces sp. NPDC006208 TaxID=3156734 RepID=UPI0033BEE2A2
MTTAQHLAAIDLLRSRPFPAERGRSDLGDSGPGYHLAALHTAADGMAVRREAAVEQYEAECEALAGALSGRWGEAQLISLWSASVRSAAGEDVAAPWDELSHSAASVYLWRVESHWIAVGLSRRAADDPLPYQLLAVVTEIDPP